MTDDIRDFKQPPFSNGAEQAVIGGLMISPESWDRIAGIVTERDFYRREHRLIFEAIASLCERGQPRDILTLSEFLTSRGELSDVGGMIYLGEMVTSTPSAANIKAYANIVREKSLLRKTITKCEDAITQAYAGSVAVNIIDDTIRDLMSFSETQTEYECTLKEGLSGAVEFIDKAFNNPNEITGISTGLDRLDSALGGFQPGDLYVIGARPAIGKTALLINMLLSAGCPVGFISTEQPRDQIALRSIAINGKVSLHNMRRGKLTEMEWPRITTAVSSLRNKEIFMYDNASTHINDLVRMSRKWKKNNGIKALYVDYLQRIDNDRDLKTRKDKVDDITRKLKNIARELSIPVIALAQVNRECEKRNDKRPNTSDLADSGDIEKEADELMFLYRDEVYNPDTKEAGVMEINITKNRHGPTGNIKATWLGEYTAVENYAPETYTGYTGNRYADYAGGQQ